MLYVLPGKLALATSSSLSAPLLALRATLWLVPTVTWSRMHAGVQKLTVREYTKYLNTFVYWLLERLFFFF